MVGLELLEKSKLRECKTRDKTNKVNGASGVKSNDGVYGRDERFPRLPLPLSCSENR